MKDLIDRSSHRKCSVRKYFVRNFAKFTEKHCVRVSFLIKMQVSVYNFAKKRLWRRCFPVNFAKFLRTPFSQNFSGRLLLYCNLTDYMYLKYIRTLLKTLRFVYYSNGTPSLELHSPTKKLLTGVPHKYKKALYSISIL